MLATLLDLPRWLVAAVVLCVLGGYAHQLECKYFGCQSPLALAAEAGGIAPDDDGPAPGSGEHHCSGQCQFVALAPCEFPALRQVQAQAAASPYADWIEHVPDAPCADIDHPPQLI